MGNNKVKSMNESINHFFCLVPPHSILAEAKNLSFNATAAFKAYSNIKANVDAAEKEAKAAKQSASEALALVKEHFVYIVIQKHT